MAEEGQGSRPNGNGEKLGLTIGGKTIGIQTRDLVSVLLIALLSVGAYLGYLGQDKRLSVIETHQAHVFEALTAQTATLLEAVHGQRSFITERLSEQRQFVLDKLQDNRTAMAGETKDLKRILSILQYNLGHPLEDRIPFEINHAPTETPVPR